MDESMLARFDADRIESRQIDELVGLARGLVADGVLNQPEVEFLQKWLVANGSVIDQPILRTLYHRVRDILADGVADHDELSELFETLNSFANGNFELGEILKATRLPLCSPAPVLTFAGQNYCFTGTFNFGQRKACERAVAERGANVGSLTKRTNVLVIGVYATDSWKHSSFGHKIMNACEWRDGGHPISIVSEEHWTAHL